MLSIRCAVECEEFQFLTIVHTFYRSTGVITYAGCWENTRKITSWKPIESAVHCFLTEKITMGSVTVNIWRSYLCTAVEETKISDPRSYEHYWTSSWNKAWKKKKFRPARDLGLLIMTFIGLHVWLKRPPQYVRRHPRNINREFLKYECLLSKCTKADQ